MEAAVALLCRAVLDLSLIHILEKVREALMEAVAETNEEYMDRYFSGEEFTYDEIRQALHQHVRSGDMVPVLAGTGINGNGCLMLLEILEMYCPGPSENFVSGVNTCLLYTSHLLLGQLESD